ncbi:MAG: peroxidase [Gemmatimonadetes bacterium]|nr:peroxidase [Gemmatimonadota bacterium]MXX73762.1 peroxidase [Gemmatimonadota bacterium]MYC90448.1 peroxidase [Gemmatimonadota bacterium]MYG34794.1 peroxidase [Gemmatimonadota bacterium]
MGKSEGDAFVHQIVSDWTKAPLSREDRALCEYAVKLTRMAAPMSRDDLARLRGVGFDDRAIHDATQVIGFFNYITRVADGLGVEPETFIERWGPGEDAAAGPQG